MAHWNPVDQMQDLVNKMGGEAAIKRFLSGELVLTERTPSALLAQVTTVSVPTIGTFIAKDHFTEDTSRQAPVRIGYLGDNFKKHFLLKTERNVPAAEELTVSTLTKASLDTSILAGLGNKAETSLAHLWYLLSLQPNGESGVLLTNGYANIFYIRGINGVIWAVCALWNADCGDWRVGACSGDDPGEWLGGDRVVSRK